MVAAATTYVFERNSFLDLLDPESGELLILC